MIAQAQSRSHSTSTVRATQSFVSIMAAVWRRPSLTAIEVLWRWTAGLPLLAVCAWQLQRLRASLPIDLPALQALTVFKPLEAGATLSQTLHRLAPVLEPTLLWLIPSFLLLRTIAAALGRAALLRRLAPGSHPRLLSTFALSALRTAALIVTLALWAIGIRWAGTVAITAPAARGAEPNLVLLAALVVFGTLALFVVWALSVWIIDAAFVLSADSHSVPAALRAAASSRTLRSQLIEVDLVMGIVKVALIVLAMVFSACPLPFENVESAAFLMWWWIGVGVLYLLTSDLFHVVRLSCCAAAARPDHPPFARR